MSASGEMALLLEMRYTQGWMRSGILARAPLADRAGLLDLSFILLSSDARSYVYSYRRVLSTLYLVDGLR